MENGEWRLKQVEEALSSHDKILRGNGTEGLVATVSRHEKAFDDIRRYVRGAFLILAGLAIKAIWDLITIHH